MSKMSSEKVIIDCDAGIDDALALIILIEAHKHKRIEILAITCVNGNTSINNVIKNVFRVLKICDTEDIPVYKGADSALLSTENARIARAEKFHGSDGLGDIFTDDPDVTKLKKEHAVWAIQEITSKFYGEVTLLCLAPLTNIALAIKLNSEFLDSVNKLIIMGGNLSAIGNITSQAEFNFFSDPESVHIVMSSAIKNMWILPWETCLKSTITLDWRNNTFGKIDSPIVEFINSIDGAINKPLKENIINYVPCDALAAVFLIRKDAATNIITHHVDIELNGLKTRGQVVIDHNKSNQPNAHIIEDIDFEIIKDLFIFAAKPTEKSSVLLYN